MRHAGIRLAALVATDQGEVMKDTDQGAAGDQRSAELEALYFGIRAIDFHGLDDAEMQRRADLLLSDDQGMMNLGADAYLDELSRRATDRHTKQVEAYAKRLDRLTTWLVGLTVMLVVLTIVVVFLTAALFLNEIAH